MKRKHVVLITGFVLIVVIAVVAFGVQAHLEAKLEELAAESIRDIDFTKLADGVYTGSYKQFPVAAEVRVTVSGHKVTRIELMKHDNGQGGPAEVLPDKVVESQKLNVDVVTGATYSSKVILKAIENALSSALK